MIVRTILALSIFAFAGCSSSSEGTGSASAEKPSSAAKPSAATVSASPSGAPSAATPSATTSAAATPAKRPPADAPFVREAQVPSLGGADVIDECTHIGGSYVSCYAHYHSDLGAVQKRYLRRIAQGLAGPRKDYSVGPGGMFDEGFPHAEIPGMCDLSKPCGFKDASGEHNSAFQCLAKTYQALDERDAKTAKAAHELACKCDPKGGDFPAYLESEAICDEQGKPAFIAAGMPKDELDDITACARCDKAKGRAACDREIERLKTSDAELSKWIADEQIPRCQTALPPQKLE
ncbi:MAG: hypothetical protein HOW73_29940 [Polyangiaceae bacterium]|nr:hypothetical protein [Polyangiaceae bacterium]